MKKESAEQTHFLEDEQQSVRVHIWFDLEVKLKEFMSVLKKLDVS